MLSIDLRGKKAFIAGIGDDQGFGWAIAKALAMAGAEILVGTWPPVYNIFKTSLERGKFDESRKLSNGSFLNFSGVYPLDAAFDSPKDLQADILENKRYKELSEYTISEVAAAVTRDHEKIDILVHSLANSPEASKPLLETSRQGYLATMSASSYSWVSLLAHFAPLMNESGAALTLSYLAAQRVIPGYGGGLNAAKAALESDTRMLAYEIGQKYGLRVNAISAGPLASRAAKAIGFIERMINYSVNNSPLKKELHSEEVAMTAAFLLSPLASAITGSVIYVDNGINIMGIPNVIQNFGF